MHSGADVEAFTAALNRDIGGDNSQSQPSDSDSGNISLFSYYILSILLWIVHFMAYADSTNFIANWLG